MIQKMSLEELYQMLLTGDDEDRYWIAEKKRWLKTPANDKPGIDVRQPLEKTQLIRDFER